MWPPNYATDILHFYEASTEWTIHAMSCVASLCDHRTCISSINRIEESARTLVVLDVDG